MLNHGKERAPLEFGHFLVGGLIARRANREQPRVSTLGICHRRMRPESGARLQKRSDMISIRDGVPDSGAPSGHIALNCLTQG